MHCDLIICNALTLGGTGTPRSRKLGVWSRATGVKPGIQGKPCALYHC